MNDHEQNDLDSAAWHQKELEERQLSEDEEYQQWLTQREIDSYGSQLTTPPLNNSEKK